MAAGNFRKVDDNVFVAGQLQPDDFAAATFVLYLWLVA